MAHVKKRRTNQSPTNSESPADETQLIATNPTNCLLFRLPNELIDQIVSWLQHPADLLALTRTCKFTCRVLTDPAAAFMWARTRRQSLPLPIPDPFDDYTESAWAAFLFGPNQCTLCEKVTFALPFSFAMRVHTCYKCSAKDCSRILECVTISIDQITSELTRCGLTNYQVGGESPTSIITAAVTKIEGRYEANMWSVFDWTDSTSIYSSKEFQDTLSNLIQAKDQAGPVTVTKLLQTLKSRSTINEERRKKADQLLEWASSYEVKAKELATTLKKSATLWAKDKKLHYDSMIKSSEFRNAKKNMKRMDTSDFKFYLANNIDLDTITSQTSSLDQRRINMLSAQTMDKRRGHIEKYYKEHIIGDPIFPTLNTFRKFPSVVSLQRSNEGDVYESLHSDTMRQLIHSDLTQWVERAKSSARILLGYRTPFHKGGKGQEKEVWKPRPGKLDPEMMASSLFTCIRCYKLEIPCQRAGVMNFSALCRHRCVKKDKCSGDQPEWKMSNFTVATRCRDAVQSMLRQLERDETDPNSVFETLEETKEFLYGWICNHCPSSLGPMHYEDMIRHSQRHESQDIGHVGPKSPVLDGPVTKSNPLSFAELLLEKHQEEANKKQFACNHCQRRNSSGASGATTESQSDKKRVKCMDFNGIRSHLKAKHHISDVRNCDFIFVKDFPTNTTAQKEKHAIADPTTKIPEREEATNFLVMHSQRLRVAKRYKCWLCGEQSNDRRFDAISLKAHIESKHPSHKFSYTNKEFQEQEAEKDVEDWITSCVM